MFSTMFIYSPGIGVSSYCPRLWSSCGDMGDASGQDCFVVVLCTRCVCLGGTGVAFTDLAQILCSYGNNNFIIVIWYITNC